MFAAKTVDKMLQCSNKYIFHIPTTIHTYVLYNRNPLGLKYSGIIHYIFINWLHRPYEYPLHNYSLIGCTGPMNKVK